MSDQTYRRRPLWPYGIAAAFWAIPICWLLLGLTLALSQWLGQWPDQKSRDVLLYATAVISLIPLLLVLLDGAPAAVDGRRDSDGTSDMTAPPPGNSRAFKKSPPGCNGSAKIVADYDLYCEGDFEPQLGKWIRCLIYKTHGFIVYLDEDFNVEWACTPAYEEPREGAGAVLNQAAELSALSVSHLSEDQIQSFQRLIGEAVARVLTKEQEHGIAAANNALEKASGFLADRNAEISRWWYLVASIVVAGGLLLLTVLLWVFRAAVQPFVGESVFDIAMGAGAGAAGALLSVLVGSKNVPSDPATRKGMHYLQGAARILAGTLGAVLIALAIKGGLFLGTVLSTNHANELFLFVCMVAGWSERLVPNFIERFELGKAAPAPVRQQRQPE